MEYDIIVIQNPNNVLAVELATLIFFISFFIGFSFNQEKDRKIYAIRIFESLWSRFELLFEWTYYLAFNWSNSILSCSVKPSVQNSNRNENLPYPHADGAHLKGWNRIFRSNSAQALPLICHLANILALLPITKV